ncbi:MAG: hypothetical protein IJS28_11540 [Synergistaceae bacterium]|nr:hypothetical protein [Synergistaceae bacterium]
MLLAIGGIGLVLAAVYGTYEYFASEMEAAKAEGLKESYENASREYEAKLRALAQEFMRQLEKLNAEIEQLRRERDEARTFLRRVLSWLGSNPYEKLDAKEQALRTEEQALATQGFTLLGKFDGCIAKAEEQGIVVEDETLDCYDKLKDITDSIKLTTKLTTEAA